MLLVLMGLPGLYLRHAGSLRWWGWISFVLVFATILSETLHSVLQIFDYPVLFKDITDEAALKKVSDHVMEVPTTQPGGTLMRSTFMMFLGGYALLGLSMLQARTLSRWPALTALAFPLLMLVPMDGVPHQFMVIFNLFYLPILWYGAILAFEPDFSRTSGTAAASSALPS
ncbi:hypothetical protein KCX80_35445 [Paenibacillus mucilaginosus]|uniref:Uncharacterized protein n=2 Tax=Paenibacillus mucilaginosus TaxID=61624 RepID=F8FGW8_PAEMK|nr:hypothetical protein KNP414_07783 [Paenibacillus mucilaginosus KNP414]WDM27577.1 hypothetical protein KCX80_35445 [Paenibacillus mucilaginosus]